MSHFDRSTTAFQEFIGTLRQQWANQLYPVLHAQHQAAAQDQPITTPEAAGATVAASPLYHWFCFIERHYQRMKYSDPRWGLATALALRPDVVDQRMLRLRLKRRLCLRCGVLGLRLWLSRDLLGHGRRGLLLCGCLGIATVVASCFGIAVTLVAVSSRDPVASLVAVYSTPT